MHYLVLALFLYAGTALAGTLSHPDVDVLNARVGTQTFAPRYRFTTNSALVETAEAIRSMDSDIIKLYLGKGMPGQYGISVAGIGSLTELARNEASVKRVLDMPFRHILAWTYCFSSTSDAWWKDGYSATERQREYDEIFAFTTYLLTNYNHSGKSFYLGHWEGDWYLLNNYVTTENPSPTAITGMIDWLNNRQKAVDDAMASVPHTNVAVYHYTEANRVRDAMVNGPEANQRLVNAVLPALTNLDFVSWSSYDGMELGQAELHATLDYIESRLPTAKAAVLPGRRVIIGEYGWGGSLDSAAQEPVTRGFLQKLLPWGPKFILFWQMYNNEPNRAYWLIDTNNTQTPCFYLHQRMVNAMKIQAARFREANNRMPTDAELNALVGPLLGQPLGAPEPFTVGNRPPAALGTNCAMLQGSVQQNIYGDEPTRVGVCWGVTDGGADRSAWQFLAIIGTNTQFRPAIFSYAITNLVPLTNYYFRFFATNTSGIGWAPQSSTFRTEVVKSMDYGARARIAFTGYDRGEALSGFPALVVFGGNLPGFSYRQCAFADGRDLRFSDDAGQLIPHEIEEWNTNGLSYVWVRAPRLESPADGVWAYWGNPLNGPAASNTNGSVWGEDFKLVWHLRESFLPFRDSSLHYHATAGDVPASLVSGKIGRAALFNGTSDFLTPGSVGLGERFTLSAWVKLDPAATSIQTIWANKTGGAASAGLALFVNSWNSQDRKLVLESGNGTVAAYASTPVQTVATGVWCQVAAVVNRAAGEARLFVDGMDRSSESVVRDDFPSPSVLFAGRFAPTATYNFRGAMDELRIDAEARSANWIWASWMNAASNSVFQAWSAVARPEPRLACAARPEALRFTWSAAGVGYGLFSATNLAAPRWAMLTNPPALAGGAWEVVLAPPNDAARFFRLQAVE